MMPTVSPLDDAHSVSPPAYLLGAHSVTPSLTARHLPCHPEATCRLPTVSLPWGFSAFLLNTLLYQAEKHQWKVQITVPSQIEFLWVLISLKNLLCCYSTDIHVVENQSLTLPSHDFVDFFDIPHMQKKIIYSKCLRGGKIRVSCSANWNLYRFLQLCF